MDSGPVGGVGGGGGGGGGASEADLITAAESTAARRLDEHLADTVTLEQFIEDAGGAAVAPHLAVAAAFAVADHVVITQSYTFTAGFTISGVRKTLEFRGGARLIKEFHGTLITLASASRFIKILDSYIIANGDTWRGNVISDQGSGDLYIQVPYCLDVANGYYFYEEVGGAALGSFNGGKILGGKLQNVNLRHAAIKMYNGDPEADITGNGDIIGVRSAGVLIDCGSAQQLRLVSLTSIAPEFGNSRNVKVIGARITDTGNGPTSGLISVTPTVTLASGSPTLTAVSSLVDVMAGMTITGAGIPASTTVSSVDYAAGTITMSANATANGAITATIATPLYSTGAKGASGLLFIGVTTGDDLTFNATNGSIVGCEIASPLTLGGIDVTYSGSLAKNGISIAPGFTGSVGEHRSTFAGLPSPANWIGQQIFVTDVGLGGSLWQSIGTEWKPVASIVLDRAYGLATSSITEVNLRGSLVPAGVLQLTNRIEVEGLISNVGTAGTKTIRVRHHTAVGTSGNAYVSTVITATNLSHVYRTMIWGLTATTQVASPTSLNGAPGSASGAINPGTINGAVASYINLTGQVVNAADVMTVSTYIVRLLS